MTQEQLEKSLISNEQVALRLKTLKRAEEINPNFIEPHILGGYLRNIALGKNPRDCDVVFKGKQLNQPGILEAVREAEAQLGIESYPVWEFENASATGYSGNFYDDVIGKYSYHTDYITMLIINTEGKLTIGGEKTLDDLERRVYDLRLEGIEMWAKHRGGGRSYASCITGDLIRALYMCKFLELVPSMIVEFLLNNFDEIFNKLSLEDQMARSTFWQRKTGYDKSYQPILDKYGIKSLSTNIS